MGRFIAAQEGHQVVRGLSEYYAHDRVFNYGEQPHQPDFQPPAFRSKSLYYPTSYPGG